MSVTQIKASLQGALVLVGYKNSVIASQAERDLKSISSNLIAAKPMIQALPTTPSNVSVAQILASIEALVPHGITVAVSISRATSSLEKLSSPLTEDEGSAFLAILQDIRTQFTTLMDVYGARILAFEILPGLNAWGLPTIQGLFDPLIQAFIVVAPANISPSEIETIKTSIDSTLQHTLSLIPARS